MYTGHACDPRAVNRRIQRVNSNQNDYPGIRLKTKHFLKMREMACRVQEKRCPAEAG